MSYLDAKFIMKDLSLSRAAAYKLLNSGVMPVAKFGGCVRVKMSEYIAYKKSVDEKAKQVQKAKQRKTL